MAKRIMKNFEYKPHDQSNLSQKKDNSKPSLKDVTNETKQNIVYSTSTLVEYALDFESKTFGRIKLKEIRNEKYSELVIKNFFDMFDFAEYLYISVEDVSSNILDKSATITVLLGRDRYTLPAFLMLSYLPSEIQQQFKEKNYLETFKQLFESYDRKVDIRNKYRK